ncbi:MAG: SPASM domain-containing protein [Saprospiraceae bacterium]|nr:SPASM domain-containing protein [Saprospiraceae bacterium]MCB0681593.1 SPASM domain-containing protein [Saprospiraceae bacterium]
MKEPFPIFSAISIQTNSLCNLKCRFCFYGQYDNYNSKVRIEDEHVYKMLDELQAIEYRGRVSLYNMNEPLTDKRILAFLRYAKKSLPDCFHFFSTNGRLLTQPLLNEILPLVDQLRINNYGELRDLEDSDPKVDRRDKTHFFQQADSNRGGQLTGMAAADRRGIGPCANPFGHLVVMPPGVAVLCCSDGFKQVQLGDIRRQSLSEIWHGEAYQTVRRALANGDRRAIGLCRDCSIEGGGFFDYFLKPQEYRSIIEKFQRNEYQI